MEEQLEQLERQQKKTNIIVITDFTAYGNAAMRYAGILAAIFNASLTVITRLQRSNYVYQTQLTDNFKQTLDSVTSNGIEVFVESKQFTVKELYQFAEESNTIMFVIGVAKRDKRVMFTLNQAIRFIKPSRIPVMTVGNKMPKNDVFQNVMLPLDIYRQSKEKSLWAGYFSRYYYAKVHILYGSYKDYFLKVKLKNNVNFTEKLYKNLNVTYRTHHIPQRIDNMDLYSLQYAEKIHATLTVIMMTKYKSLFDWLFGVKERSVIANEQGFPVLCLNEREDLYVLCT
ncbi:MAG: hypothetical protein LBL18_04400 [Bacteroidales bacterium]|jgi:hypothetical protein|nr:hypothetical protein [Bacteroidales bacterium]